MRTYYINNGNENGGPFTIEELRSQQISTATLVWYNGMDEWKYAVEIEELKHFFNIPPPIAQISKSIDSTVIKIVPKTIFGLKKSHFILAIVFTVIMIFILVLNIIQNNKKNILDERNRKTELDNAKVRLEQKVDLDQRIQNEIQLKIASENSNNFRKDSVNNRLFEIKNLLIVNKSKLTKANINLDAAQKFKLLRSEDSKEEQISALENEIQFIKDEIDKLEIETNRLYLLLETIH